jgi:hypothetical protein
LVVLSISPNIPFFHVSLDYPIYPQLHIPGFLRDLLVVAAAAAAIAAMGRLVVCRDEEEQCGTPDGFASKCEVNPICRLALQPSE